MIAVSNASVVELVGAYIVPVLLPVLVGLVTTKVTSSGVKAVLLATLSVATSLLTSAAQSWSAGTPYDLVDGLINAATTFTIAVASHYGLWKPTGVSDVAQTTLTSDSEEYVGRHVA